MKKTTRNIIISLAVLLVLGAAAAVLILTNPLRRRDGGIQLVHLERIDG